MRIQREHIHRIRASSSHVAKWKNGIQFQNSDAQHANGTFCNDCGFFCEIFISRVNLLQFVRPSDSIFRCYFFMSNSSKAHHHLNIEIVQMLQTFVWTWTCSFSSSISLMWRDMQLVASIPVLNKLKLRYWNVHNKHLSILHVRKNDKTIYWWIIPASAPFV